MRTGERVFVDTGAWIALALTRDPLHERASAAWKSMEGARARLYTSIPIVLETFTFLDRNAHRDVALSWKESIDTLDRFELLECRADDVDRSWPYLRRSDLHNLSAVDATSFALMKRENIGLALAFDHHFAAVGFRMVG